MTESLNASPIKKFGDVWAESFFQFLSSHNVSSAMAEANEPVPAPAPTAQEFEKLVCIRFSGAGAVKGELLWVAEKSAALQLAQLFKSEPPSLSVEFAETQREAFAELLRQIAAQTAATFKTKSGAEIDLVLQTIAEPAPVTAQSITVRLAGEKFPEITLRMFLNEELCSALSSMQPPAPAETQEHSSESVARFPPSRTSPLSANLGLVLDVELEATIRFGEREMLLRDIFGLIAGSVVELNQMVNEPAELLVAGRLVARGEVVVVDGNFGLRVTEVASVNERVSAIQLRKAGRDG